MYRLSNLWVLSENPDREDVVDHLELAHVPVEVVVDLSLLTLYEPMALAEFIVSYVLAKVEGLYDLLYF